MLSQQFLFLNGAKSLRVILLFQTRWKNDVLTIILTKSNSRNGRESFRVKFNDWHLRALPQECLGQDLCYLLQNNLPKVVPRLVRERHTVSKQEIWQNRRSVLLVVPRYNSHLYFKQLLMFWLVLQPVIVIVFAIIITLSDERIINPIAQVSNNC